MFIVTGSWHSSPIYMLAGFEGPKGPSQPDNNVPVSLAGPRHRCVRCIMTSLATTVKSHENAPNIEFSYVSLEVWNDGNSRKQIFTIGRLFQSCLSNYSQQEKLEHSEYVFITFTKFLLWVNLWYFGAWIRVAARAKCGTQTMRIQIPSHCYSRNPGDYIKTHGLILTDLWKDIERNVFSLCAKLRVCPLFEISTIDQPLFLWLRPAS